MKEYDRYRYSNVVPADSETPEHYGIRRPVRIPDSDDDISHTVVDGDRLDALAWRYYRNPHLGWIIAEKNGISKMWKLRAGTVLRIPAAATVEMKILG